jgi:hypothetical protein
MLVYPNPKSPKANMATETIKTASTDLLRIINDILDFSKVSISFIRDAKIDRKQQARGRYCSVLDSPDNRKCYGTGTTMVITVND